MVLKPRTRLPRTITRRWWATRGWWYVWAVAFGICATGFWADPNPTTFVTGMDKWTFAVSAVLFWAAGNRPESRTRRHAAVAMMTLATTMRALALILDVGTDAPVRARIVASTVWLLLWLGTTMIASGTERYCTRRREG